MPTQLLYISEQSSSCSYWWFFFFFLLPFIVLPGLSCSSFMSLSVFLVYIDKSSSFMSDQELQVTQWYECSTHPHTFRSGVFSLVRDNQDQVWFLCEALMEAAGVGGGGALFRCLRSPGFCIPLDSISPSAVDFWMFIVLKWHFSLKVLLQLHQSLKMNEIHLTFFLQAFSILIGDGLKKRTCL